MKIFHTADLHLGKVVQEVSMVEDQAFILQQFIQKIDDERPDVIVIAGDIYDRSVPPTEAVKLYNETLIEIVLKRKVPVLAIAGNHDSAERIHFGSELLKGAGLYHSGKLSAQIEPIILSDEDGEVHFYLVPFAEPSIVRQVFADETIHNYDEAMRKIVASIEANMDKSKRNVLIAHGFFTPNGEKEENTSTSERTLVGGTECIDASMLEAFDYVALGHLHQPHYVRNSKIQYAGSPLKYSESEVNHNKCFLNVSLTKKELLVEKEAFIPRREMIIVRDTLENILKMPVSDDYAFVKLLDQGFLKYAVEQVRTVYPNALQVEREGVLKQLYENTNRVNRIGMNDHDLFEEFYREIKGDSPDDITIALFKEALDELETLNREKQEV